MALLSKDLFNKVFPNDNQLNEDLRPQQDIEDSYISFQSLETFIETKLSQLSFRQEFDLNDGYVEVMGRLGSKRVIFDVCSNVGSLVIDSDRLGLSSHSGFSSIKANCCVYRGKWQYEVMLNTKGVMQLGWATTCCQFSQEKGVGDTNDSYAYDGNRVRKWNVSTLKYGDNWQVGDCITCTIDLDEGNIDFYRNGKHLGTAFKNVRIGKSYAYYPAISLAYQESVLANFGSTPLRFPVEGYQPLEATPNDCITAGSLMIDWICNIIVMNSCSQLSITQYLICNKIFSNLSHIITNKYVIEECLLKKFLSLNCDNISTFLDLMWTLLEEQTIHDCLEFMTRSIINGFRFSPIVLKDSFNNSSQTPVIDFEKQKQYLLVLLSLVKNTQTRHYLLKNILFESKFPLILDIKSIEDEILTSRLFSNISIETVMNGKDIENMRNDSIESAIEELESLQDLILSNLLFVDDLSRITFVNKLDAFVRETVVSNSRSQIAHQMIPNLCQVVLSLFQRLTSLIRNRYKDAVNLISVTYFIDNESISKDITRIGGTASYLLKQNQNELSKFMEQSVSFSLHMKHIYTILDNLIKLYTLGAHKHLAKLCAIREHLEEYTESYKELKERYKAGSIDEEVAEQTFSVLESKIMSYSRQLILINSNELNESKKANIFWLMKLLLNTLEHASSCGHLFSFIPDYFLETLISLCSAIRFSFTVSSDVTTKQEYESLIKQFASFIASHFNDERVTIAELKDNLSQALASFVSNPETLSALESISLDKRMQMVRSLCQPYENRAWAQSNWTMLRFWKGSGFAYRYSHPPNISNKFGHPLNKDQTPLNFLKPYPSVLYQSVVCEYLTSERNAAIAFLSSLLCQLNWSFSEFIGMLQEIQNSANRPQKVYIDSRQLKICSTCFDLTLALLRVLEMIVRVSPELITLSAANDMILTQLSQLVCQILNRVTISGSFNFVVQLEIQELDNISHFQILASVTGILIALTLMGSQESKDNAISYHFGRKFFAQISFFLIGKSDDSNQELQTCAQNMFNLANFEEVSEEENLLLREMISTLVFRHQLLLENKELIDCEEITEDEICTICYANKKVAIFSCGHQSCRSCIAMHFLRHGEKCFFCKALIERVIFNDSDEILYPKKV